MNRMLAGWIGGTVGAITVTGLHELIRHFYGGAPRLDKLGEQAAAKIANTVDAAPLSDDQLYTTSMIGDIMANATYYSTAAATKKNTMYSGMALGLMAGMGALKVPEHIGLDPETTNKTTSRKLITVGLYTLGGIVAGYVIKRLTEENNTGLS